MMLLRPIASLLIHTGSLQIPKPRQRCSAKRQVSQHQAPQKQKPQQQLHQRQFILLLNLRIILRLILQIIRVLQRLRNQLFQHLIRLLSRRQNEISSRPTAVCGCHLRGHAIRAVFG